MIGNDVWLEYDATILPRVTIGNGAVVAAKSVVTRDVPPYAIVAGHPATLVRRRVPPEIAKRLQAVAWWDWDIARITRCLLAISAGDVAAREREAAAPTDNFGGHVGTAVAREQA